MTRDEAIAVLQEEIDGNLELTLREWRERDEQRLFPALRMAIEALSADAVTIHEDGTLEVKVSNAHKIGRVLVMDTDSHIGGGLFYQDDSDAEWIPCSERLPSESGWYVISVVGFEYVTDVSYFYSDELKWSDVSHTQSVTAWMPLPKPYREDGEDE